MMRTLRAAALSLLLALSGSALWAQTAADPRLAPLCTPDDHTLCLDGERFSVTAGFQQTVDGPIIEATAVTLTDATGYFWFFDPQNVELIVKVLNGCAANNHYWVFAAGLTNVGVQLAVKDLRSELQKVYDNPVGTPFAPIQDTTAFATCP
jgi:hypothetical protein